MVYSDKEKDSLYLYIGYFPIQRQGKELVGYASSALHKNAVEIPVGAVRINKTIVNDTRTKHVLLFWYDFNGQSVANRYYAKGLSIWNAVWSRRNNGALIVISHPLSRYDNEAQILNREILFVETLLTALRGA
jgi:EpsI family protein